MEKVLFFTDPSYQYNCLFTCFFSFYQLKKKMVRSNCIEVHVHLN